MFLLLYSPKRQHIQTNKTNPDKREFKQKESLSACTERIRNVSSIDTMVSNSVNDSLATKMLLLL